MKVLGIDPGLKATGYGLIDVNHRKIRLIETGTIEPKKNDLIQNRIKKVYTILDEIVKQYNPDMLILEKLYAHYEHPTTAVIMGHLRGVICLLCAQRAIELKEHSPKRIRKAVTGNGNATKMQVKKMVAHILNMKEENLTDDASDALALALGYVRINEGHL